MDNIIFVLRYVRFISVYWVMQVLYYLRKGMIYFYDDNIKL